MAATLVQSDDSNFGTANIAFPAAVTDGNVIILAGCHRSAEPTNGFAMTTSTTNTSTARLLGKATDSSWAGDITHRRGLGIIDWEATQTDGGVNDQYDADFETEDPTRVIFGLEFSGLDNSSPGTVPFEDADSKNNGNTADGTNDLADANTGIGSITVNGQTVTAGCTLSADTVTNNGLIGGLAAYLVSGSNYLLVGWFAVKMNGGNPSGNVSFSWDGDLSTPDGSSSFTTTSSNLMFLAYAYKEITVSASGTTIAVPTGPWR